MSHTSGTKVYLVAAVAANGVIGKDGHLPWHLPQDLRHFKRVTIGHPVIMGRRTWESLRRPLAERENIVVTRRSGYQAAGAAVSNSLEAALALCDGQPLAFVIGGNRLFAESLPVAAGLVMTEIHRDFLGDAWFPDYDRAQWRETQREAHSTTDGMRFDFVLYERR